ncbi:MAG: amino acid ABC transporter substrate-binding protein [Anaerolineales bacterium]|nr:amino acid ABC transporter substrate-binding protein [Anaerolineales bacterium]
MRGAGNKFLGRLAGLVILGAMLVSSLALRSTGTGSPDYTWRRIHEGGTLVVGVDPSIPPFAAFVDEGLAGIDVEVAQALGAEFGVPVRFVLVTYDGMFDALYTGQIDLIIAALRPDTNRAKQVFYTQAYFDAGQVVVGLNDALPQHLDDLSGQRVVVEFASDGDLALRPLAGYLTIISALSVEEAIQIVLDGEVDYALIDAISARLASRTHPQLQVSDTALVNDPYVIAMRRSDWRLYNAIENILNQWKTDGTLEAIIRRWL